MIEENEKGKKYYKKKIERCKKLGAEKFQKAVFALERLKFKVLKKYFPNYLKNYESKCDRMCKKDLKKARTEEERELIIAHYREQKLLNRKEMNTEKNRNYHMDNIRPTQTVKYLEWNKDVHRTNLIMDLVTLPVFIGLAVAGVGLAIPLIAGNLVSSFINFQCINLQNYNIFRFKAHEEVLKKREQRKVSQREEEFSQAYEVINSAVKESSKDSPSIPSIEEVINNIKNKEQLAQFRNMILQEQGKRASTVQNAKVGGVK